MGVIVTRRPDPWWAAPLTQLVTGQIDAMMDRTQEAKKVEGQRAFAGMLSQLAQENPDLSETELYTRAMADPSYSRAGEQGAGMLKQILAAREKERAEGRFNTLVGGLDPRIRSAVELAAAAKPLGLEPTGILSTLVPKLERQQTNLGNRITDRMVNPITGEAVGDAFTEQVGISPDKQAQIEYDTAQDKADLGYKYAALGQNERQFRENMKYNQGKDAADFERRDKDLKLRTEEAAERGFVTLTGTDGQTYFVNPGKGIVKPSGVLTALTQKETADVGIKMLPHLMAAYTKVAGSFDEGDKKQAQMWFNLIEPIIQGLQGAPVSPGAAQGSSGIPAAGNGAGAGKQPSRTLTEADRERLRSKGWTAEQIANEERRRSGM